MQLKDESDLADVPTLCRRKYVIEHFFVECQVASELILEVSNAL